jgi:hypothetical protein
VADVESAKHRNAYVDPAGGRMRYGELAGAWAEVQDWAETTRQGWGQTVKRLQPLWGLRLDDVDKLALERLRADLAKRYSRRVVRNTMLRALAIARYGFECGYVGRDPTIGVEAVVPGVRFAHC